MVSLPKALENNSKLGNNSEVAHRRSRPEEEREKIKKTVDRTIASQSVSKTTTVTPNKKNWEERRLGSDSEFAYRRNTPKNGTSLF